ncbi:HlyD family efflux transporter periplasmic adaptor subunit [Chloroflexota bacterium]
MKIPKILLTTLIAGALAVPLLSCASDSDSDSAPRSENQAVTVQRGDLIVDITAAGNLALSRTEELAFDLFYPAGARETVWTVEEVLVEEGDPVEEGQVLAKVDTSEWAEGLSTLDDRVTAAERQVTAKKRALIQYELNLIDAKSAREDAEALYIWPAEILTAREAVRSAENEVEEAQAVLGGDEITYDRNTGQYRYQEAITAWDIKVWTDTLVAAEETLRAARANLEKLLVASAADAKVTAAAEKLRTAQANLDKLLAEPTPDTVAKKADRNEEIERRRMKVELAQQQLENAQQEQETIAKKKLQLEQAEGNVEDAQQAIKDAEKSLKDAQEDLDEARSKSPLITATFDGFVTQINIEGGDEVKTGAVAVIIADPNKFEADILVSEMDILQLELGGEARVQVDARPEINLPAKVTHISPTATIQSGVVNYAVKVELQSLEALAQERPEAKQGAMEKTEQTEERIGQGQQEEGGRRRSEPEAQQRQLPMMAPEDLQLREGLTVTVSITVDERRDVLLVPNTAITRQREETHVQVLKDGVIEERTIKTGISDWQSTEVTDGLSGGEQIIVSQGTATTTPAGQQGQSQRGISRDMRRILR